MQPRHTRNITRREAVRCLGTMGWAAAGVSFLISCAHTPSRSLINWQPRLQYPVFHGVRDVDSSSGAPGPMRIFFPSLDWIPARADILRPQYPYPAVLFLHGHCSEPEHYKRWQYLPLQLARSGYVVAVPDLPYIGGGRVPDAGNPDLARAREAIDFLRDGWEHASQVEAPPATAILGHSFGALLGAYLIDADRGAYAAFASLSGALDSAPDRAALFGSLGVPGFYLYGTSMDDPLENRLAPEIDRLWPELGVPRHRARLDGAAHWDYLPPPSRTCEGTNPGRLIPCISMEHVAADLVTVFVAKYVGNTLTRAYGAAIPDTFHLRPPRRTSQQEAFAAGHLQGFEMLSRVPDSLRDRCSGVHLEWRTAAGAGTRSLL